MSSPLPSRLARAWLWLSALLYLALGLWLLTTPEALAAVDLSPATPTARTELRAMYGGLELGLGAFLVLCALRPGWAEPGLALCVTSLGGLALGRGVGLGLDAPGGVMTRLIAFELVWTALSAALWARERRGRGPETPDS